MLDNKVQNLTKCKMPAWYVFLVDGARPFSKCRWTSLPNLRCPVSLVLTNMSSSGWGGLTWQDDVTWFHSLEKGGQHIPGQVISYVVLGTSNVTCYSSERKHGPKEWKATQQVHQVLVPTCAPVEHCHHSFIVTMTAHYLPFPHMAAAKTMGINSCCNVDFLNTCCITPS